MNVRIVCQAKHFLYLPLYFAESNDFFGLIPKKYNVITESAVIPTDEFALEELFQGKHKNETLFAVCDPMPIISKGIGENEAVILAGLVKNAAFWAVDHNSDKKTLLRDLAEFDKIICFQEGTTSYRIANDIVKFGKENGKSIELILKDEESTLRELTNFKNTNTIALSPNIPRIQKLIKSHNEYKMVLEIGITPEYSNILVTALTTKHYVIEKHKDLVVGLLASLIKAMNAIKCKSSEVIEYVEHFGEFRDISSEVIDSAIEADVFPFDLMIKEMEWRSALNTVMDIENQKEVEIKANKTFNRYIKNYSYILNVADSLSKSKFTKKAIFSSLILVIPFFTLFIPLHPFSLNLLLFWACSVPIYIILTRRNFIRSKNALMIGIVPYFALTLSFIISIFSDKSFKLENHNSIISLIGLLIPITQIIYEFFLKRKK